MPMGRGWKHSPENTEPNFPAEKLIRLLVEAVSKGGNLLLGTGPRPDGRASVSTISSGAPAMAEACVIV